MKQTESLFEKIFKIGKADPVLIYGFGDQNIKLIQESFPVRIAARGDKIRISGPEEVVAQVENVLSEMVFIANKNQSLLLEDVETVIHIVKADAGRRQAGELSGKSKVHTSEELDEVILFTRKGYIKPRTKGQLKIVRAFRENDIVVAVGPAGTGKTYLAVALAVAALKEKEVTKIVLARPAVDAGESLGFLPGDYREKIDPYLRPLYDALGDMLPRELIMKYLDQGIIEVLPLAYMRGRTLNNAFAILDEAQNATSIQMKMFLTRLGVNSKAMINGDITQVDIPETTRSGLIEIQTVLKDIEGIEFIYLDKTDVVRHQLVRKIIHAYDEYKKTRRS